MHTIKTALTIAGSDCSGGAGIQADLKTFSAHKVYGMSAITSITSQNTKEVSAVFNIPAEHVKSQLDSIFTDIFPDSVKIGMVSSTEIISAITDKLKEYQPKNIVLDPVMISTSGCKLLADDALSALTKKLLPLADLITPNIPEAEFLLNKKIHTESDMELAVAELNQIYHTAVLLKGGHNMHTSNDLLCENGTITLFKGSRIDTPNTHGTGCTLSSAIAANLALGFSLCDAIKRAKAYITRALSAGLDLGTGSGPLYHFVPVTME